MVRLLGIEPRTSGSTIRRSNHLSYNRTSRQRAPREASARRRQRWVHTDKRRRFQDRSGRPVAAKSAACADTRNPDKEKGRGRRSGLFLFEGQREEVPASGPLDDGRRCRPWGIVNAETDQAALSSFMALS